MKWDHPAYFEKRIVKRFLWFPCRIDQQVRWLETVLILQEFRYVNGFFDRWTNIQFVKFQPKG